METKKIGLIISVAVLVIFIVMLYFASSGYSNDKINTNTSANTEAETNNTNESQAGIANPASVHCEENGYALEIRTAADGSQVGICKATNGKECEEWAFFRGNCTLED